MDSDSLSNAQHLGPTASAVIVFVLIPAFFAWQYWALRWSARRERDLVKASRVPLAQAEAWLRGRVDALAREEPQGGGVRGWLRRSIRARLFAQVEKLTQAKFRDHGAQHGGVDLMRVRDELAGRIDQTLVDTLKAGMFKVTALLVAASMLGSALLTFAIATVRA